jgi:putative ABC transport system permease protein
MSRIATADRSRLRGGDILRVGAVGLRVRRTRAVMSAAGIAIGIACIVGVLGITQSSQADLVARIDQLGTNLLTVQSGRSFNGDETPLPESSAGMVSVMPGVQHVSATARLSGLNVYRTDAIPAGHTNGLAVRAADPGLLSALDGRVLTGSYLSEASARYPVAVLGSAAASALGIDRLDAGDRVWISGQYWPVIGILAPLPLAPEIDASVVVGAQAAELLLGFDGAPTLVYVRAVTQRVGDVAGRLASTVNPQRPDEVTVNRPSDVLTARLAVTSSSTALFLGLGAVALLIAGVGIANVMLISVLERRSEIGLRRSLGATQAQVAAQFLTEALLLGLLGGAGGLCAGAVLTAGYATYQGWTVVVPPGAVGLAVLAALAIGGMSGLYPAVRAARLSPTDALRSV